MELIHKLKEFLKASSGCLICRAFSPFKVIKKKYGIFFLWLVFTLLGGLLGPLVSSLTNVCFTGRTLSESIIIDARNGTFYTYSIVLIASSIGGLFIKLISEDYKAGFKNIKLYFIAISIFPLFLGGVLYSGLLSHKCQITKNSFPYIMDKAQFVIFCIGILLAIYAFCLEYMTLFPDDFKDVSDDNYHEQDDEAVKELNREQSNPSNILGDTLL
ncbi:MAG: hypothetical protein KA955_09910 [Prevotella sp.]|nr:hypothetical protein [Prevotella sp.]